MPTTRRSRGGGGSSRPAFISEAGKQAQVAEANRCDAKLNPERRFLKRKRRDGSSFTVLIETGERCPAEAVISKRDRGKTVHRCAKHLGGY